MTLTRFSTASHKVEPSLVKNILCQYNDNHITGIKANNQNMLNSHKVSSNYHENSAACILSAFNCQLHQRITCN